MKVPSLGGLTKKSDALESAIKADALRDILTVGGVAGATGLGLRGLLGAKYLFGRRKPDLRRSMGPTVLSIPTPVYTNPRDAERAQAQALKMGATKTASLETRSQLPWYYPGLVMGGIGGLAGGYKLMDVLAERKRKLDLQSEEEDAKVEYQRALLSQYNPASVPSINRVPELPLPAKTVNPPKKSPKLQLKIASAIDKDLDALAEKSAADQAPSTPAQGMPGWMGKGLGVYGAFALPLMLGTGLLAYKHTKDRSTNKLIEEAIKARERERWNTRPPEIYAIPTPVRLSSGQVKPTAPALEGM